MCALMCFQIVALSALVAYATAGIIDGGHGYGAQYAIAAPAAHHAVDYYVRIS